MKNSNEKSIISAQGIVKHFGKRIALNGINFVMRPGSIIGISGANGSGKSVFLRILSGLIRPTSGHVEIFGQRIGQDVEFPQRSGIMIDSPGFLISESGIRNLELLASIQGKIGRKKIEDALQSVGLKSNDHRPVSTYSTGMRQRLGLAQAIMEDPELLILDEPTNGLDFDGQRDIYRYLIDLREQGKSILITSHSKDEIKILCDKAFVMAEGTLTHAQDF